MRLFASVLSTALAIAALAGCGADFVATPGTGGGSPGTGGAGGAPTSVSASAGGSGGTFASSSSASSSSGSSTTSSASSTSSSASSSSGSAHGDCASDNDCPSGKCVEVLPGGFRVCKEPLQEATQCNNPGIDQCCDAMPCGDGHPCYLGPLIPYCGGAQMLPYNQCAMDQCTQDSECPPEQFCGKAGTLGRKVRACIPAGCEVDANCNALPGGVCAPVEDPCCHTVAGLFCVYPNGGCRTNGDCPQGSYCTVMGNKSMCVPGAPICPG